MTPGDRRPTTAVLGGGALGLTTALRLSQRGHAVTVIERESLPGGLAAGFEIEPGMWLEKFYHHLFRSDRKAVALIEEVGLGDRLAWSTPLTATLRDGRIHQLDSPASLLRFSPLPMVDRLRMGAALATLKAMPNPRMLEGRTAADWIRRWMGDSAYDVVWEPLLRGKFGAAAPEIALPWFWARVHDRTQQLGYLRGGFQQMYLRLSEAVREAGGETRFGTSVAQSRPMAVPPRRDRCGQRALRPRDLDVRAAPHGEARARAAADVARPPRVGTRRRRALPGPGAGSAADIGPTG